MKRVKITKNWGQEVYQGLTGTVENDFKKYRQVIVEIDHNCLEKIMEYNEIYHQHYINNPRIDTFCLEEISSSLSSLLETE